MKLVIEKEDLEKIINYLSTKPWREVSGLMKMLETNVKMLGPEPEMAPKVES